MRPSSARAAARRASRRAKAGAAARSPCRRRSAGPRKSRKQASVESGLPGRPNTSVAPRRPNHSGLPGLSRTRQNTSSTPRASKRGLDVVVLADRHAAGDRQQRRRRARPRSPPAWPPGRRPRRGGARRRAPALLGQQPQREPVGLVDAARARAARRPGSSSLPVASTCTPRAAVDRDRADAGGRERGHAGDVRARAPAGREHGARARRPRRGSGRAARAARRPRGVTRPSAASASSTRRIASAPGGQRRARGDPDRRARARARSAAPRRRPPRRPGAAGRR